MMKLSDFQGYIDLHGADLSRWPKHEIRSAIDLIQHDPKAGKILSATEKLDQMLRHYPSMPVNAGPLTRRIMQQARPALVREKPAAILDAAYLYISGGSLLVVAILGFMLGFHPTVKETFLIDPVFYTQDQLINDSEEAS